MLKLIPVFFRLWPYKFSNFGTCLSAWGSANIFLGVVSFEAEFFESLTPDSSARSSAWSPLITSWGIGFLVALIEFPNGLVSICFVCSLSKILYLNFWVSVVLLLLGLEFTRGVEI